MPTIYLPILYLTLTSFLFPLPSLTAQHDFAPIGAQWIQNMAIEEFAGEYLEDYYVFTSEKDTLIDGLSYRKVGDYLFYQNGDLVYYLWQDSLRLIYDYGVAVGDTVVYEMFRGGQNGTIFNTLLVDQVDYVFIDNDSLKRISCSLIEGELGEPPYVYLERMGCVRKIVEDFTDYSIIAWSFEEWLRCYQDSSIHYQTERFQAVATSGQECTYRGITNVGESNADYFFRVFPNPVRSGVLRLESDYPEEIFLEIFDCLGRSVIQQKVRLPYSLPLTYLPQGIYSLVVRDEDRRLLYIEQVVREAN